MVRVADPVGSGLVASLARPGGNVTGVSSSSVDLVGKHLQMLKEMIPGITQVAFLAHGGDPAHKQFLKEAEDAGRILGVRIQPLVVDKLQDIEQAFLAMARAQAGALIVQPVFVSSLRQGQRIAQLATQNRLPTISNGYEFADVGGLIYYGPDRNTQYR